MSLYKIVRCSKQSLKFSDQLFSTLNKKWKRKYIILKILMNYASSMAIKKTNTFGKVYNYDLLQYVIAYANNNGKYSINHLDKSFYIKHLNNAKAYLKNVKSIAISSVGLTKEQKTLIQDICLKNNYILIDSYSPGSLSKISNFNFDAIVCFNIDDNLLLIKEAYNLTLPIIAFGPKHKCNFITYHVPVIESVTNEDINMFA